MRFRRMTEEEMYLKTPALFLDLKDIAKRCADSEEIKKWLWLHTVSEEEFRSIRRCMLKIAAFRPGVWEGSK